MLWLRRRYDGLRERPGAVHASEQEGCRRRLGRAAEMCRPGVVRLGWEAVGGDPAPGDPASFDELAQGKASGLA